MARGRLARGILGHHADERLVGERVVGPPTSDSHFRLTRLDRMDEEPVEVFGAERARARPVVFLEQVGIYQPVLGREGCAGNSVEPIDFGHPAMDRGGVEFFDRMAQFALQREMLLGLGPGRGVVEPEITLWSGSRLLRARFRNI